MKRKAITPAMKIDALLWRFTINCGLCQTLLSPNDEIEWDHVHALVHGGQHDCYNLRPVHAGCHKLKSAKDVKANAKVKRLRGETRTRPSRKIPSRPFPRKPVARGA